ncbi:MAG TPA: hypothetical protein VIX87_03785 [Steroidobacteraceae bacterium]
MRIGPLLSLAAVLAAAVPCAYGQSREAYCGAALLADFDPAADRAHSGRYVNSTYGYSVTIPPGLTAVTSASGPERGFMIRLSTAPRAFLSVDASYDAFYDITAAGVHRRDLNTIDLHDAVLEDAVAAATLAHSAGGRYRMRVQCRGHSSVGVHEEVIVLRKREIYRVDLQSTPERYAQDERLLEAVLKSWRWERLRPATPQR